MKLQLPFYLLIILSAYSCSNKRNNVSAIPVRDTIIKHDTIYINQNDNDWQKGFGLSHDPNKDSIWFKPVSYYLSEPGCSGLAYDFYMGTLKPSDNGTTDELLKLSCTDNPKLRPFYRWCLNKTIFVQDGALAEHTGIPARRYAEKFPKEFFQYMDIDSTGEKYLDWTAAIYYSGYYDNDDYRDGKGIRKRLMDAMKKNCTNCDAATIKRIDKFAMDCFK